VYAEEHDPPAADDAHRWRQGLPGSTPQNDKLEYPWQADAAQKPFWHSPEPPMHVVDEGLNRQDEQQGVSPEHWEPTVS
jgi:hypothetical protein